MITKSTILKLMVLLPVALLFSLPNYSQKQSKYETVFVRKIQKKPRFIRTIKCVNQKGIICEFYKDRMLIVFFDFIDNKPTGTKFLIYKKRTKINEILGHTVNQGLIEIFFSDRDKRTISSFSIDTQIEKLTQNGVIQLRNTDEFFVTNFEDKEKFFLLSIVNKSSTLKLRAITDRVVETLLYDLSDFSFGNFPELYFRLADLSEIPPNNIHVQNIDKFNSSDLSKVQQEVKASLHRSNINITIDDITNQTTIINLNIEKGTHDVLVHNHSQLESCGENSFHKSNSVAILGRYLFVNCCKNELNFAVSHEFNLDLIKTFKLRKDTLSNDFKFSVFKEEIGQKFYKKAQDRYATAIKILRKSSNNRIAIGTKQVSNDIIEVDLGYYETKESLGYVIPTPYAIFYSSVLYPYNIFIHNQFNLETLEFQKIDTDIEISSLPEKHRIKQLDNWSSTWEIDGIKYLCSYYNSKQSIQITKPLTE